MVKDTRYALIADIHANIVALDAVLAQIDKEGIDEIVCLGDIVGYGPRPRECIERVKQRCEHVIAGNHDRVVMSRDHDALQLSLFDHHISPRWYESFRWTHRMLCDDDRDYLRSLPLQLLFDHFVAAHAKPNAGGSFAARKQRFSKYLMSDDGQPTPPMLEVLAYVQELQVANTARCMTAPYAAVFGHTHKPYLLDNGTFLVQGKRKRTLSFMNCDDHPVLVNVPSVGLPRDGDKRAGYAIIDGTGVSLVRIPYDVKAAVRMMFTTPGYDVNERILSHVKTGV